MNSTFEQTNFIAHCIFLVQSLLINTTFRLENRVINEKGLICCDWHDEKKWFHIDQYQQNSETWCFENKNPVFTRKRINGKKTEKLIVIKKLRYIENQSIITLPSFIIHIHIQQNNKPNWTLNLNITFETIRNRFCKWPQHFHKMPIWFFVENFPRRRFARPKASSKLEKGRKSFG